MDKAHYRLRRIAYSIKDVRDYLTFIGPAPQWGHWTIHRGHIPRRLWWQRQWRRRHIVEPVLRERRRWAPEQLSVAGILPAGEAA